MAISTDGYIAKKDGDSDWVSEQDFPNFQKKMAEMGCIIVGNRTFQQYQGVLYPVRNVTNLVLTSNKLLKSSEKNVVFCHSVEEVLSTAQETRHDRALLIGGGTTNGLFLEKNLIDETYFVVHPLLLGEGIKLFENSNKNINLRLLEEKVVENKLVYLHYDVEK